MITKIKPTIAICLLVIIIVMSTVVANMFTILPQTGFSWWPSNAVYLKPEYDILEVNSALTEKYGEKYHGYMEINNNSYAAVNRNDSNRVNVLHLSESVNIENNLIKSEKFFDFRDSYDLLPIVATGMDNGYNVGQKLTLTMYSEIDESSFDVKCIVVNKIFLMDLPQYKEISYEQFIDSYKCTLIVPDVYRDKVFAESDEYSFRIDDSGNNPDVRTELQKYGVVMSHAVYSTSSMYELITYAVAMAFSFILVLIFSFITFKSVKYDLKKLINIRFIVHFIIISVASISSLLLLKLTPLSHYFIINIIPTFILLSIVILMDGILYYIGFKKNKKNNASKIRSEYERI